MKEKNYVDNTITTLEMCAGYGGIGLGIKNIFGERLRTLAYCELEGFAQANLISKMEKGLLDAAPIWNDLKTFPYESFHGLVDVLIAGYPCQPFSAAGKRAGKEDPRHLWPWIADGIRLLQPTMCLFENVEGHISLGLSTVISDLEELGYKVSWGIFSAREVGAPHQRKRVFILAHRKDERLGRWAPERWEGQDRQEWREIRHQPVRQGDCGTELALTSSIGSAAGFPRPQQGHEGIAGVADNCGDQAWPSRPGEPQYAWEPPRVTGAIPEKLANFCTGNSQSGGDTSQASSESVGKRGEGADAMPHGGSSLCGGDQGNEQTALADTNNAGWEAGGHNAISIQGRQPHELAAREGDQEPAGLANSERSRGEEPEHQQANLPAEPSGGNSEAVGNSSQREDLGREPRDLGEEASEWRCGNNAFDNASEAMGNSTSERSHRGGEDGLGLQPEMLGEGYEAVGNADHGRLASGLNARSGAEADRGGQGDIEQADGGTMGNSSNWRGGESRDETCEGEGCRTARSGWSNEEQRKIECEMGRDAYEPSIGVGISELSGLSHSELAEIREWMVKTDNRTDELRLLGNGVVPATAERAFLTLLEKLK